jgi:hypothetical protein
LDTPDPLALGIKESALKSSSPSDGVIENEQNDGADNRHQETVEVKSTDTMTAKDVEQPAAKKGPHNSQQDVEYDAFTSPIYELAADEPGDQA